MDVLYDESKVPEFILPDSLLKEDGRRVGTATEWPRRRAELLDLFAREMYGRTPEKKLGIERVEILGAEERVLGGAAKRKEARLWFGKEHMDLLLYKPNRGGGPSPIFLGLNFGGNQAAVEDPAIHLPDAWMADWGDGGVANNRATSATRGKDAARWALERIVERGYGLATIYYGDLDPDFDDGFQNGIQPLFYRPGQTRPEANEWGSIGAWAWGLSRAVDYLEGEAGIDAGRVAVMGHSRLGKAALWAGAQDERFGLVISNDSGCGGAALSKRRFGETVGMINERFPHWFCANFKKYSEHEEELPFDQHELIALMAPRPVYIASAEEDLWADPRGEFLAGVHASPVYELFGIKGLDEKMPGVNEPNQAGRIGYHLRSGKHDVTPFDWECYLDFADKNL